MAPQYERARVLAKAVEIATKELQEPIGRIVVFRGWVTCWGATKKLSMTFWYENAYSSDGHALPGSGSWKFRDIRVCQISFIERLRSRSRSIGRFRS